MDPLVLFGSPMLWPFLVAVLLLLGVATFSQIIRNWWGTLLTVVLMLATFVSFIGHIQIHGDLGPVEIKRFGWGTAVVETSGCTAEYPLNILKVFDGEDPLQYPHGVVVDGNCGDQDSMDALFSRATSE